MADGPKVAPAGGATGKAGQAEDFRPLRPEEKDLFGAPLDFDILEVRWEGLEDGKPSFSLLVDTNPGKDVHPIVIHGTVQLQEYQPDDESVYLEINASGQRNPRDPEQLFFKMTNITREQLAKPPFAVLGPAYQTALAQAKKEAKKEAEQAADAKARGFVVTAGFAGSVAKGPSSPMLGAHAQVALDVASNRNFASGVAIRGGTAASVNSWERSNTWDLEVAGRVRLAGESVREGLTLNLSLGARRQTDLAPNYEDTNGEWRDIGTKKMLLAGAGLGTSAHAGSFLLTSELGLRVAFPSGSGPVPQLLSVFSVAYDPPKKP